MPTNRVSIDVELTHEELAIVRRCVEHCTVADQKGLVRAMSNDEAVSLWVTIMLDVSVEQLESDDA